MVLNSIDEGSCKDLGQWLSDRIVLILQKTNLKHSIFLNEKPPPAGFSMQVFHQDWANEVKSLNFFYNTPAWLRESEPAPEKQYSFHISARSEKVNAYSGETMILTWLLSFTSTSNPFETTSSSLIRSVIMSSPLKYPSRISSITAG